MAKQKKFVAPIRMKLLFVGSLPKDLILEHYIAIKRTKCRGHLERTAVVRVITDDWHPWQLPFEILIKNAPKSNISYLVGILFE